MKHEILGFNQESVLQFNNRNTLLPLDIEDLLILYCIKNNVSNNALNIKLIHNKAYTWFRYKNVLEDLPILDIAEKRLYQRIKKYKELGLIDIITQREKGLQGSKTYLCCEPLLETLTNN